MAHDFGGYAGQSAAQRLGLIRRVGWDLQRDSGRQSVRLRRGTAPDRNRARGETDANANLRAEGSGVADRHNARVIE